VAHHDRQDPELTVNGDALSEVGHFHASQARLEVGDAVQLRVGSVWCVCVCVLVCVCVRARIGCVVVVVMVVVAVGAPHTLLPRRRPCFSHRTSSDVGSEEGALGGPARRCCWPPLRPAPPPPRPPPPLSASMLWTRMESRSMSRMHVIVA
jgi:hypothetical protein